MTCEEFRRSIQGENKVVNGREWMEHFHCDDCRRWLDENDLGYRNTARFWSHDGPFLVELTADASTSHLPSGIVVSGNIARVQDGKIERKVWGIQLYAEDKGFSWDYDYIRAIRDGEENLLWFNSRV